MTRFLFEIYGSLKKLAELLKLSIISPRFYSRVYSDFTGYGLRYIFVLCFIGTIFTSIFIMTKLTTIDDYFETKKITNSTTYAIDYVLNHWQTFDYNGSTISCDQEEPVILNGNNGKPLLAIDAEDKISGSIKKTIPIIFGKSKLMINLVFAGENTQQFSYEYIYIFGTSKKVIDSAEIIKLSKDYMDYLEDVYIIVGIPIMLLVNFFTIIFEKILMTLMVYFAFRTFVSQKATMKSSIRTVAFSSGVAAVLQPLTILSSIFGMISGFMQLWTSFLIIYSIIKMKKKEF